MSQHDLVREVLAAVERMRRAARRRAHRVLADRGCTLPSAQQMFAFAEEIDAHRETEPWIGDPYLRERFPELDSVEKAESVE